MWYQMHCLMCIINSDELFAMYVYKTSEYGCNRMFQAATFDTESASFVLCKEIFYLLM